jgi:hypothetical protein
MEGYIKLNRRLLESDIWNKPPLYLKVWMYLLCQASHQPYGNLQRGQLVTSVEKIQDAVTYKEGAIVRRPTYEQVRNILRYMRKNAIKSTHTARAPDGVPLRVPEESPMISMRKVTGGLLVTIEKYSLYQGAVETQGNTPRVPLRVPHRDAESSQIFIDNKNDNKKNSIYHSISSNMESSDFGNVENWKGRSQSPEDFWKRGKK